MKTLMAEDDPTSRMALAGAMKQGGLEVVETSQGAAAWAALPKPAAPALAIQDWMMLETEGREVVRRIRARPTACPPLITILTARRAKADANAGLEAGAEGSLAQPCPGGELSARLEVGRRLGVTQPALSAKVEELPLAPVQIKSTQNHES
ncbi:MAG: response regulator [Lacunisphaera sp.]|nr:response regulator [Lacunisphaera sp.]